MGPYLCILVIDSKCSPEKTHQGHNIFKDLSTKKSLRSKMHPLSWKELGTLIKRIHKDFVNGPPTSQACLRLFGQPESSVRVTLYRDHHAWCPYCQKVWLWLEEKKVPYKVKKVTMFCYGEKESWYKKICPSGMLPALELDGKLITESDHILAALETQFGPLYAKMDEPKVRQLRHLERQLFSAWCRWLCYPSFSQQDEQKKKQLFIQVANVVDNVLSSTNGPYFLEEFSTADVVFVPYVERMNASLFYYKGFLLRDPQKFPNISKWFDALETRETYRGTQSDFHTHVNDLPPQMGGCYESGDDYQLQCKTRVDSCTDFQLPECKLSEPENSKEIALQRVLRHREAIVKVNPVKEKENIDKALRATLTYMMTNEEIENIPNGSEVGLRYIKERINIPRDMPIWSARRLREALEKVASNVGPCQGPSIPTSHRKDQDPKYFRNSE